MKTKSNRNKENVILIYKLHKYQEHAKTSKYHYLPKTNLACRGLNLSYILKSQLNEITA